VCANLISNSMRVDHPCHPPTMGERRGGGGDRKATASRPQARNPCKKQPGRVRVLHTDPGCLAYRNMHDGRGCFLLLRSRKGADVTPGLCSATSIVASKFARFG